MATAETKKISLAKLHNHPCNPEPTSDELTAMVQWLAESGQDEPITVRPLAGKAGHFEILAGKTRHAGAKQLRWKSLDARIRNDLADEETALAFMARSNRERRVENAIRQATMLATMTAAGTPIAAAAKIVGLGSDSAARNKMQLLKLPPVWQQRVASGELPETAARAVVPYCECDVIMAAFDKDYQESAKSRWPEDRDAWTNRNRVGEAIDHVLEQVTRPLFTDKHAPTRYYPLPAPDYGQRAGCILDDPDDPALKPFELPTGKNGKLERWATNVKLFDKLTVAKLKAQAAKKTKPKPAAKTPKKKLTPAQQRKADAQRKADDARRAKEANARLAVALKAWWPRFVRCAIAWQLARTPSDDPRVGLIFAALVATAHRQEGQWNKRRAFLEDHFAAGAFLSAQVDNRCPDFDYTKAARSPRAALDTLINRDTREDPISAVADFQLWATSAMLWPQCKDRPKALADVLGTEPPIDWHKDAGKQRDRAQLLVIDTADVDAYATMLKVSLIDAWIRGATARTTERELIRDFLELHTKDQLTRLAPSLGCNSAATAAIRKRSDLVEHIIDSHTPESPLKLPAVLGRGKKTTKTTPRKAARRRKKAA